MKKTLYIILFLVMVTITIYSQSVTKDLPATAAIIHYKLQVGYNTTTVLIFPASVRQADRGERDLLIQKQAAVENVLKVKAARKDFTPTNLHVFTSDGRVYAFDVSYTSDPVRTTFDLAKLEATSSVDDNPKDRIELTSKPLDEAELASNIAKVKAARPFFSTHSSKYKMKVQLQAIYRSGDILFLSFEITNRSSLPYPINFTKLYIRDKKRAKRSSVQEREITPLNNDTISTIPGKSSLKWVVAIPQLTILKQRQLIWEIGEKNGGRLMTLKVKNHWLLQAKDM